MANNDTVLKDEVAELASQDIPELADRNRNSLMLLTLFLIKTKDWDGNYKLVKFILKDLTVFEVCKLLQATRVRLSRMRSRLRQRKANYKQFTLTATYSAMSEQTTAGSCDWEVSLAKSATGQYNTSEILNQIEDLLQ